MLKRIGRWMNEMMAEAKEKIQEGDLKASVTTKSQKLSTRDTFQTAIEGSQSDAVIISREC